MDPTDLALCKLFLENSRIPIREIGDKLGLSVAAVHGRLQALRDMGVIKAFTARLDLVALGATLAFIWGTCRKASNDEILARLHREDHIYWVAFAGAGFMYVGAYLRSVAELDAVVSHVTKEADIAEPMVGLIPMGAGLPEKPIIDRTDSRILRSLHKDARKSVADVAEELGISSKTAGRRLGRMIRDRQVELSMEWYPDAANDVIAMWHVDVSPSVSRDEAISLLTNSYGKKLLFTMAFSNTPRFFIAATWTGSMKELHDLHTQFGQEKRFARAVPNVIYTGKMFDTWRDELIMKWAGPKEPNG